MIKKMLSLLKDKKEIDIITSYFGLNDSKPQTLEEISERLNLTKERVRQIREKSIKKLRILAKSNPLLREVLNTK
jgi:RNA polymerase primary sigma factor